MILLHLSSTRVSLKFDLAHCSNNFVLYYAYQGIIGIFILNLNRPYFVSPKTAVNTMAFLYSFPTANRQLFPVTPYIVSCQSYMLVILTVSRPWANFKVFLAGYVEGYAK